ncbi:MAG: YidB family protein [Burkholderiaceae bacterium]
MFDLIIREVASRFGLGDKAGPLVQMLLAYITNKDTGGIAGFMSKLSSGGLGDIAKSWLGGGASALPVSSSQIESLLGGQGDLLSGITSKLGIGGSTASSALGFLLPMIIGKLTPGGSIPTSLSTDVMGFITGGASALTKGVTGAAAGAVGAAGAATVAASKVVGSAGHAVGSAANAGAGAVSAAASAGGGLMKWLPWLAAGIAALFLLSYCNKGGDAAKQAADGAKNAAASAPATATADAAKVAADAAAKAKTDAEAAAKATADAAAAATAKTAAEVAPAGSGLVAFTHDGAPALKVYFDSGKTAVAAGFAETSKELVGHLKANASSKAVVTGFNDPTGNATANAELSKNRAKGVAAALKAAGIAEDRVLLEKPADTTGSALSNSEARRVEVTIRK